MPRIEYAKATERWIMRAMARLARRYVKDRYPEGCEGKRVYLSLSIIKPAKDSRISIFFSNEYGSNIGEATDIEYPVDKYFTIKCPRGSSNG